MEGCLGLLSQLDRPSCRVTERSPTVGVLRRATIREPASGAPDRRILTPAHPRHKSDGYGWREEKICRLRVFGRAGHVVAGRDLSNESVAVGSTSQRLIRYWCHKVPYRPMEAVSAICERELVARPRDERTWAASCVRIPSSRPSRVNGAFGGCVFPTRSIAGRDLEFGHVKRSSPKSCAGTPAPGLLVRAWVTPTAYSRQRE
jgi:hypothetical protein